MVILNKLVVVVSPPPPPLPTQEEVWNQIEVFKEGGFSIYA